MAALSRHLALPLVVLLLGGCASMPKAAELVESQQTPEAIDEEAAAAALRGYIDAVNAALDNGDVRELATWTHRRCPCVELVAFIRDRFAEGGQLVGAELSANDVNVASIREDSEEAVVRARIAVSKYNVRSADGLSVSSEPARDFVARYTLRVEDGQWRVVDVQQAAQ